jgi:hypothetical protein
MKRRNNKLFSRLARVRFLSPAGFLVCALAIAVAFAGLEALGLRSSVATLAGTNPAAEGWNVACLYLLCYLAFVGLVPILILGSIFLLLINLIITTFGKRAEQR